MNTLIVELQPPTMHPANNSSTPQPSPETPQLNKPRKHKAQHLPKTNKRVQGPSLSEQKIDFLLQHISGIG
ncbi:Hypothetical predicted protein [Pelobates cultripes]|uniref:Uncharacterized protein n=1 Tax=Pelobates cultripes TaxID=61616 RepID=A0AAD1W612_PELCU|nr:Hypothetical predicted protein [Pelobates cultripes]